MPLRILFLLLSEASRRAERIQRKLQGQARGKIPAVIAIPPFQDD